MLFWMWLTKSRGLDTGCEWISIKSSSSGHTANHLLPLNITSIFNISARPSPPINTIAYTLFSLLSNRSNTWINRGGWPMSSNQPKTINSWWRAWKTHAIREVFGRGFFFMTQRQRAHPQSGICSHFQQLLVLRKDVGRISY